MLETLFHSNLAMIIHLSQKQLNMYLKISSLTPILNQVVLDFITDQSTLYLLLILCKCNLSIYYQLNKMSGLGCLNILIYIHIAVFFLLH